jgi:pimeloyl-ACP methyl ester carboxylesterase
MTQVVNVLSVRSDSPGQQNMRTVRRESGADEALRAPHLVILIHGYQNSKAKASKSFARFRAGVRTTMWVGSERSFGEFWEFHWPGSHPVSAISVATYSARVGPAILAGTYLADFLDTLKPNQTVDIVAHSLGCRVALETISRRALHPAPGGGARIRQVHLLAAAVPAPQCVAGEPLERQAAEDEQYVYYSMHDRALSIGFPLGQRIYGERGAAVGRDGSPDGRWTSRIDTQLGHSDYWPSLFVAADVAGLISGRVPPRTPARVLARMPVSVVDPREGRRLDERALYARVVA